MSSGFEDLTGAALGLFDMKKLEEYTADYSYLLATPYWNSGKDMLCVGVSFSDVYISNNNRDGVRPVVSLPSNAKLTVIK